MIFTSRWARVYTSDNGSVAGPSRSTELHYHLGTQISLVCEVRHGPTHHSSVHWIFQVRIKYFRKYFYLWNNKIFLTICKYFQFNISG